MLGAVAAAVGVVAAGTRSASPVAMSTAAASPTAAVGAAEAVADSREAGTEKRRFD